MRTWYFMNSFPHLHFRPLYLPPPEDNGTYPEDQERDDESAIDSSLSFDEVTAWITGEVPGLAANPSGDEDEEVVGFGHEDLCGLAGVLEPFDSPPPGLGGMVLHKMTGLRALNTTS